MNSVTLKPKQKPSITNGAPLTIFYEVDNRLW